MVSELPEWALENATPRDRARAEKARQLGVMAIEWPPGGTIRKWAKQQGWPAPWFIFDDGFVNKMLESDENFALALNESGIEVTIPIERYAVSDKMLRDFDKSYAARDEDGRPTDWGLLVEDLRELRHVVEAGVVVEIEGKTYRSSGSYYNWVHGRYYLLEDGYDSWVGDDRS